MTTESVAPKTAEAPAETPPKPATDVAATVARLRKTFASGRTRGAEWRKQQLLQLARMMEENEDAIAKALAEDLDRSPAEAFIADVATTLAEAKYAAKRVRRWMRRKYLLLEVPQLPGRGWVEYEPYGTVLIIGAWNYPFYLTLGPAVGAIAAGNAVVLKPSEIAAASSRLMAELVPRYLDRDAIAVVEGDGTVSQELIMQGLDRVMFTGGTEIGRKVYEGAARHLTPVTLELGGKSPQIVFADADLDAATEGVALGIFANQGEVCAAGSRILVARSVYAEFVDRLAVRASSVVLGDPFDSATTMGPLINARQVDRVLRYLKLGHDEGARLVTGGGRPDRGGYFVEPTLFSDAANTMTIAREEIFGPVGTIIPFYDDEQAIQIANDSSYALAATLWTTDLSRAHTLARRVRAGAVAVNGWSPLDPRLSWGGSKLSGQGRELGLAGLEANTELKTITVVL